MRTISRRSTVSRPSTKTPDGFIYPLLLRPIFIIPGAAQRHDGLIGILIHETPSILARTRIAVKGPLLRSYLVGRKLASLTIHKRVQAANLPSSLRRRTRYSHGSDGISTAV